MGGIFAISVAVFRSLFEGLKGHEKRPKIYQIDANSKDIHWVLKFLKSISHELNAEVGKVRHQKLEKSKACWLYFYLFPSFFLVTLWILSSQPLVHYKW